MPRPVLPLLGRRRGRRPGLRVEVAEGLLLLEYGVRMRLKNRIVIDILTTDGAVEPTSWAVAAHAALGRSIDEAGVSQARLGRLLRRFRFRTGGAEHLHDYGVEDLINLLRRKRLLHLTVRELRRWQEDADRLADLVAGARRDALDEIGQAIAQVMPANGRAEDDEILRARIAMLEAVDLPDLARRARHPTNSPE